MIKAAEVRLNPDINPLSSPLNNNLPPLINNLLIPNSSITNNELEIATTSPPPPASPVLPTAKSAPASPISINSPAGEPPCPGNDSSNPAEGLGSPCSTTLMPIGYVGSRHPKCCSTIPYLELTELEVLCAGIHQYCA